MIVQRIVDFFREHELQYKEHIHEPVYTVDEAKAYRDSINGIHCKNLFLRNRKKTQYYLLSIEADKCITCASCVRICREAREISALSFVNRGFVTKVTLSVAHFERAYCSTKLIIFVYILEG